jgi:hypothetical protein
LLQGVERVVMRGVRIASVRVVPKLQGVERVVMRRSGSRERARGRISSKA